MIDKTNIEHYDLLDMIDAYQIQINHEIIRMSDKDLLSLIVNKQYNWELHWNIAHQWIINLLGYYYQNSKINYDGISEEKFTDHYGYSYGDDFFSKNQIRGNYNVKRHGKMTT